VFCQAARRPRVPSCGVAIVLVTGAARGIGRAVTQRLVADGHRVHGLLRSAASQPPPGLASVGFAELSEPQALAGALQRLVRALPRLDGLVHCAGIVRPGALADAGPADYTDHFAVHVVAVAELTRLLLPALRAAAGTVVLVNSGSGRAVRPPLATYGVSKHALVGYAEALRQEEPGIRVTTVYPGRTATDMQATLRAAEGGDYRPADYLRADTVATVVAAVLALPADGMLTDVVLRPFTPG
jgi:NAD(P)-dependent dehydrogenase (short-subunit alcohol dehydrogenase family)